MSNEIMCLTKQEVERNPEAVGENLVVLAKMIEDSKSEITNIKDRSSWKRLTSNNTRDLAEALLKQNEIISAYITVVQGIIWLTMNNIGLLTMVMDSIEKNEYTYSMADSRYTTIAKQYMTEAIKAAEQSQEGMRRLEQLERRVSFFPVTNGSWKSTISLFLSIIALMVSAFVFLIR